MSSFTAEAGRSTTSPAAMRFAAAASSCRIGRRILGVSTFIPQGLAPRGSTRHRLLVNARAPRTRAEGYSFSAAGGAAGTRRPWARW